MTSGKQISFVTICMDRVSLNITTCEMAFLNKSHHVTILATFTPFPTIQFS